MKFPILLAYRRLQKKALHFLHPMVVILFAAVFFVGCSSLTASLSDKTPETEEYATAVEAQRVLATLKIQNQKLKSFKGLGKIKVWYQGKLKLDERAAWIGSETVNLSIVVLISGHPVVKMATDGKWFYYYEARQDQPIYEKVPATDASLKKVVTIPIKASDVIHLLAGRVPLREHHSVKLKKQSSANGYVLELKRKWSGLTERIFLDENKSQVKQIEFFDHTGSLTYRASFEEMQNINGYQVPAKLRISKNDSTNLLLRVDRYFANVPVSPSMFALNPPK